MAMWRHKSVVQLIKESGNPNPIDEIKSRARELVLRGFELGWEGPPYSPIKLARLLEMDVTPNDSVMDARTIPIKNNFQIQYNPFQKPTRISFSVAHEIAHTLFPDCADEIRNREDDPQENKQLEQLCNAGAAEIQLPYAAFSEDANNAELSIEGLLSLATKYKASIESVFRRYVDVTDKSCACLIGIFVNNSHILIDYWHSSKSFLLKIPEEFVIPNSSKAYECVTPGWTAREIGKWGVFDEECEIYAVGISPYKKDRRPRVGVLVVPRSASNKPENEDKIVLEYGDATKPRGEGPKIIAQVVNTGGGLGAGFGKSLAKNYQAVKEELARWSNNRAEFQLGESNLVKVGNDLYVFQMLAQKGLYAKGMEIPLKYLSLQKCLRELAETAKSLRASVHMPQIGAGQAKGDWKTILGMIHDELINNGIKVSIYFLPGKPYDSSMRSNLAIFKADSTWETGKLF